MTAGSSDNYQTMSLQEIVDLPVQDICCKDSVLFLWTTTPLKLEGIHVLNEWGFQYKTTIYWRKIMSLGMGFWFRGQVEECLLGIRGKIKPFRCQRKNVIECKRKKHSAKPHEMYELIDQACPDLKRRIELFARYRCNGWDVWGYDAPEASDNNQGSLEEFI